MTTKSAKKKIKSLPNLYYLVFIAKLVKLIISIYRLITDVVVSPQTNQVLKFSIVCFTDATTNNFEQFRHQVIYWSHLKGLNFTETLRRSSVCPDLIIQAAQSDTEGIK